MRALVIDVGNSRTAIALWEGDAGRPGLPEAGAVTPLGSERTPVDAEGRGLLAARCAALRARHGNPPSVLVSVVPTVDPGLLTALPGTLVADHAAGLPFANAVEEPAAVGADRYCNVAAAVARGWRDALVVDVGTATTFDLLCSGVFVGGLIAPGMAFAAQKLGETAARLAPVAFTPGPLAVAADTAGAMRAGAFQVGVRGILGTIEGLLEVYGARPVVLTGGLGGHLERDAWPYDPHWTLRGAVVLAWPRLAPDPSGSVGA